MVRENNSFFIFFLIKNTNLFNIALSGVANFKFTQSPCRSK